MDRKTVYAMGIFLTANLVGTIVFWWVRDSSLNEFVKYGIFLLLGWIVFIGWAYPIHLLDKTRKG